MERGCIIQCNDKNKKEHLKYTLIKLLIMHHPIVNCVQMKSSFIPLHFLLCLCIVLVLYVILLIIKPLFESHVTIFSYFSSAINSFLNIYAIFVLFLITHIVPMYFPSLLLIRKCNDVFAH